MSEPKNNNIYLLYWHVDYFPMYFNMISEPKFSQPKYIDCRETLFSWYGNWTNLKNEFLESLMKNT